MKAAIRDRDVLAGLQPAYVLSYLRAHGWQQQSLIGDVGAVWEHERPTDGHTEVLIPLDADLADYAARISDMLRVLESVENRSQLDIARDLQAATDDVIRFVLTTPAAAVGNIALVAGVDILTHTRDLVLAAACSVTSPERAVFSSRKPTRALEYINDVQLGQTERGSFVLTVLSPVPPVLQSSFITDFETPFERQVTVTLARALDAARRAVARAASTGELEPFQEMRPLGINANLLEAVAGLLSETPTGSLRVRFSWSPSRPEKVDVPSEVAFTADATGFLTEAARLMRAREPRDEFRLEGLVVGLARDAQATIGEVNVLSIVDEGWRHVHLDLNEAQYSEAARAHAERLAVRCTGELTREGRSFTLRNPRHFAVVSVDEV